MKYLLTLEGASYTFEATHWKFYPSSTAKFCPACGTVWAAIRLESSPEVWPEIAYCVEHAAKATSRIYPSIFVIGMPLPGSVLDFWSCTPEHPTRDPLDELPEDLIRREFNLYLHLIDIGVLRYESASSDDIFHLGPTTVSLDSWLQNPS